MAARERNKEPGESLHVCVSVCSTLYKDCQECGDGVAGARGGRCPELRAARGRNRKPGERLSDASSILRLMFVGALLWLVRSKWTGGPW
jgi:hypothetical protein